MRSSAQRHIFARASCAAVLTNGCAVNDELFLDDPSRRYVSGPLRALTDMVKAKGDWHCEEAPGGAAKARDRQSKSFVDRRKRLLISENASWFIQRQTSGTGAILALAGGVGGFRFPPNADLSGAPCGASFASGTPR